jgi:hypothetical protein
MHVCPICLDPWITCNLFHLVKLDSYGSSLECMFTLNLVSSVDNMRLASTCLVKFESNSIHDFLQIASTYQTYFQINLVTWMHVTLNLFSSMNDMQFASISLFSLESSLITYMFTFNSILWMNDMQLALACQIRFKSNSSTCMFAFNATSLRNDLQIASTHQT